MEFSKIKLRTKEGSPVSITDLDTRELMLSNYEKVVFVKDLDGNVLRFLPVGDSQTNLAYVWSASSILQEFTNFLDTYFDVIDGGTF